MFSHRDATLRIQIYSRICQDYQDMCEKRCLKGSEMQLFYFFVIDMVDSFVIKYILHT